MTLASKKKSSCRGAQAVLEQNVLVSHETLPAWEHFDLFFIALRYLKLYKL